uniref:Oxidative stress induced growth inhibitor family member 2 n=1 Tax=Cyprinus carpio TaxID=7962 RepID=A0A8C1NNM2_CYPCA
MPLLEEGSVPRDCTQTVPVVIIGNGPSGICLSYLLSGYTPYLDPMAVHPNPILFRKLQEAKQLPITEQDLEFLCEGLEGRSGNPVAVLFDTLLHPNADLGFEFPSVLQWRMEKKHNIPHLILGKATPGGAWHAMEGSMLTISLGVWMELPGVNYKDLTSGKRRSVSNDRATPDEISSYYKNYVKLMGLQKNFVDNTYVTSSTGVSQGLSQGLWEVRGYQQLQGDTHVPFSLFAENVVLATGASDSPARLGVEGEDLPYVFHSVRDLGVAVSCHGKLGSSSDPVLVVGAGLSAADAVLCTLNHRVSVLHAFRKRADDPGLIFKQLPKTLYPEYHRVYHMMCSQVYPASPVANPTSSSPSLFPDYTSFPEHCVLSFQPDMHCVMRGSNGVLRVFKVSMVLVLIGTYPNLFFLKEQGQYLGLDPSRPISCRQNPIDINPYTFECNAEPGLFAMGPLVGDNFVRFLKGGALGIASCLRKRLKQRIEKNRKLITEEEGCGRREREGSGGRGGGFV